MPHVEGLDSERLRPRCQQATTCLLVAVLNVGDPGRGDLEPVFADPVSELLLAPAVSESHVFDPNHRAECFGSWHSDNLATTRDRRKYLALKYRWNSVGPAERQACRSVSAGQTGRRLVVTVLYLSRFHRHDVGMNLEPGWRALAYVAQKRRARLGLTQEEVAGRGGPSTATLRSIEAGSGTTFRAKTLFALDDALGWMKGTAQELVEGPRGWDAPFADFVDLRIRHLDERDYPMPPAPPEQPPTPTYTDPLSRLLNVRRQLDLVIAQLEGATDDQAPQPQQGRGRTQSSGARHPDGGGETPMMTPQQDAMTDWTSALQAIRTDPRLPDDLKSTTIAAMKRSRSGASPVEDETLRRPETGATS